MLSPYKLNESNCRALNVFRLNFPELFGLTYPVHEQLENHNRNKPANNQKTKQNK